MLTAAGMVLVLRHASVRQWVIASLCVSCLSATMALVLVTTRLGWPKVNFRLLRERALEGVGFSFAASTTSVYNDIDKAMLSRYGMLAADGIYSMAYRVIDMSCTPIRALQSAAFPRFCQTGRNGARGSIAFTGKLLSKTLPLGLLAAAAMFLAAPIIPHIVGRASPTASPRCSGCAFCRYFAAFTWARETRLTGAGYQRYRTAAQLGAAALNFASTSG